MHFLFVLEKNLVNLFSVMRDLKQYRFTLFDTNPQVVQAWQQHFQGLNNFTIKEQNLQSLTPQDVLVVPTNSFGILETGIAQEVQRAIPGIDQRVHKQLSIEWEGQQPPGNCTLVKTETDKFRYLAMTSIMRTQNQVWTQTIYDAFRSVILAVTNAQGQSIQHIACPGLGTGQTGRANPDQAAQYMRLAYDSFHQEVGRTWSEINQWLQGRL